MPSSPASVLSSRRSARRRTERSAPVPEDILELRTPVRPDLLERHLAPLQKPDQIWPRDVQERRGPAGRQHLIERYERNLMAAGELLDGLLEDEPDGLREHD